MAIIQLLLSAIICGILYSRMIRREVPELIGKSQAITPVVFGILSDCEMPRSPCTSLDNPPAERIR